MAHEDRLFMDFDEFQLPRIVINTIYVHWHVDILIRSVCNLKIQILSPFCSYKEALSNFLLIVEVSLTTQGLPLLTSYIKRTTAHRGEDNFPCQGT